MPYYDWNATLAYDAKVTCVVGARGIGKTYGMRKQVIRDYLKNGWRFVAVVRYEAEITGGKGIQTDYFRRIIENGEFPDCEFKVEGSRAYISKRRDDKDKPVWEMFGYFAALSTFQRAKQSVFSRVKRIVFDEAMLERTMDKWHDYLPNEVNLLSSLVNSIARQNKNDKAGIEPRVYILGNACSLVNPYFARWKIYDVPEYGYHTREGKQFLLHYCESDPDAIGARDSVANFIAGESELSDVAILNEFLSSGSEYLSRRPSNAKFSFGMIYRHSKFGIWLDEREGYYYVDSTIPNGSSPVYALTADDAKPNYVIAKRAQRALKGFAELYYMGCVRYANASIRDGFLRAMKIYGIY